MCFDRNKNDNSFEWHYWSLHKWKYLILVKWARASFREVNSATEKLQTETLVSNYKESSFASKVTVNRLEFM